MELTVDRAELSKALGLAGRALPGRSTLPILRSFELHAAAGDLRVTATDLERSVRAYAPADVREGGAVCVGPLFAEFVGHVRGSEVRIETRGERLVVQCARESAKFPTMPAEEFPAWPAESSQVCDLDADLLKRLVKYVLFAAATDESRPVLCGVHVQMRDSLLTLAASDGFRLAVTSADAPGDAELDVVLPARTLSLLSMFPAGRVTISRRAMADATQVLFVAERLAVCTQLILGKFPDWRSLIPTRSKTRVVTTCAELAHACKLVQPFTKTAHVGIWPAVLGVGQDHLSITVQSAEVGEANAQVACETDGPELRLGVNVNYLLDMLQAMDSEQVALLFMDHASPLTVRPVDDGDSVCVIMPMRLDEKRG